MKLERAKGTRDFGPKEKILRQKVIDVLRGVFELYGYSPIETPVIERFEILAAKFGVGEESDIMKEIFTFQDQGKRKLGLRYELTFPLARYIGMNPHVKMPFKRYQIGRVFRDGPIKLGRYREFWQCDADIVGAKSVVADAEILALTKQAFAMLGLKTRIEISNRKLLNDILDKAGVKESLHEPVIIIIDKLLKIGEKEVKKELGKEGLKKDQAEKIMELIGVDGTNNEKLQKLKKILGETDGVLETGEFFFNLYNYKVDFDFNPSLARGLAYYTGPIYEVFLKDSDIKSSVAAGGRYDEMIGKYLGGKKNIPSTGISFGMAPITEALQKEEQEETVTKVFVIPIKTEEKCVGIVQILRSRGINTDMDLMGRGISKNLNYANKLKIPYVIFAGEEEIKQNKVKLRDMKTGEEKLLPVEEVVKIVS